MTSLCTQWIDKRCIFSSTLCPHVEHLVNVISFPVHITQIYNLILSDSKIHKNSKKMLRNILKWTYLLTLLIRNGGQLAIFHYHVHYLLNNSKVLLHTYLYLHVVFCVWGGGGAEAQINHTPNYILDNIWFPNQSWSVFCTETTKTLFNTPTSTNSLKIEDI